MNLITDPLLHKPAKLDYKKGRVQLAHGSGGRMMAQLIDELFLPAFANPWLAEKNDQACFAVESGSMAMTTDAFVISPLFFPGGNIGSLAIHGTINDLVMCGAIPRYLSASFILEQGLPLQDLRTLVHAMAAAAKKAKVAIITGDTKVVERGKGDGVFISTTGLGWIPQGVRIKPANIGPGDKIILSGYIGDHGVAVMAQRNNLQFQTQILSDSASLHDLVANMVSQVPSLHALRDPTRGGVATALNELAVQAKVGMLIDEQSIPVRTEVASACELLGLDPLYVANEGKLIAFCPAEKAATLLAVMRAHPLGKEAAVIGEVVADPRYFVQLRTKLGGMRIMTWLAGEQLPRIC